MVCIHSVKIYLLFPFLIFYVTPFLYHRCNASLNRGIRTSYVYPGLSFHLSSLFFFFFFFFFFCIDSIYFDTHRICTACILVFIVSVVFGFCWHITIMNEIYSRSITSLFVLLAICFCIVGTVFFPPSPFFPSIYPFIVLIIFRKEHVANTV